VKLVVELSRPSAGPCENASTLQTEDRVVATKKSSAASKKPASKQPRSKEGLSEEGRYEEQARRLRHADRAYLERLPPEKRAPLEKLRAARGLRQPKGTARGQERRELRAELQCRTSKAL
jgi:hypothetical protein